QGRRTKRARAIDQSPGAPHLRAMSFESRIRRTPIPFDPVLAAAAMEILTETGPATRALIGGAAGCSPYLSGLIAKESGWLAPALDASPESALDGICRDVAASPPDLLAVALRTGKRRVALLSALADLGGVWPLEQVTGALTRYADLAVDMAMKLQVSAEIRRGKLPGMQQDDVADAAGMVALAMGKMGAHELNFSSDIDLICLFDESRFEASDYNDARAGFIRITRRMSAMLSDITGEGYVFRTDLRLRPDPSVTPVCLSMDAAERYYESVGRTWERAAHIKARPCAGDLVAGAAYLERLRPFIWRKHLDFAAIQDAHDMRLRIRDHKRLGGPITLPGHNMKLGRGGIREIEFFTQTRQIIAGGRDPDLRVRETVAGLAALANKGWLPDEVASALADHYRQHREIEHRLQMVADAQTHSLPTNEQGFTRLARFTGESDTGVLKSALMARLGAVHALTESFFAPDDAVQSPEMSEAGARIVEGWRAYPALRSNRAQELFKRVKPAILTRMDRAARPHEALVQFDGFLAALPAGVQLLSLFEANPQLIDLLVDICATSPALARYLSRNAKVLDAVLGGDFFAGWPGMDGLAGALAQVLNGAGDYESALDSARRFKQEWHFRIGVHHLRGLVSAAESGAQYADLAGAVVGSLWPVVSAEFARKHGAAPGAGAVVLGMGSLGAGRLNAGSDLDLIVIYDAGGVEHSDGRRPLATRPYYARLTQALVTALSAPMAEGRLYQVDMRLRPSGRKGPVATSYAAFKSYQRDDAWTWEHLALTRARVVAGDAGLGRSTEDFRRRLLSEKGTLQNVLNDVIDMRARLAEGKPSTGTWDAKSGPGYLQDIELFAQTGALIAACPQLDVAGQLVASRRIGWITGQQAETLGDSYDLLWRFRQGDRLLSDRDTLDMDEIGEGGRAFLLRETSQSSLDGLAGALENAAAAAAAVIEPALLRQPPAKETR
ncbi:MAG: bifunctional [glutamine synthetase] adenylyltransferase/[glutamine synthetase]-adenylyl-L-tyrosine phosphorylase, partial [Hyphomicrobiales bacterium]